MAFVMGKIIVKKVAYTTLAYTTWKNSTDCDGPIPMFIPIVASKAYLAYCVGRYAGRYMSYQDFKNMVER